MDKEYAANRNPRESWIDILKFLAIIAVMIDHTNITLYSSRYVAYASFFSVTTFVFLGGACGFASQQRHKDDNKWKNLLRREKNILIPYLTASAFYLLYLNRMLDLRTYISTVLNFTAADPFYYVLVYCQLIAITYPLSVIVSKCASGRRPFLYHFIAAACILAISALSLNYTYILPVYGGGQFLFGGTYLFVYYLGMLFEAYRKNFKWTILKAFIIFPCSLAGAICFVCFTTNNGFLIDNRLFSMGGYDPPGINLLLYTLLLVLMIASLNQIVCSVFREGGIIGRIWKGIGTIGAHSLYIFLYHALFIAVIGNSPLEIMLNHNIWIKRIFYFTVMIGGSVIVRSIGGKIARLRRKYL